MSCNQWTTCLLLWLTSRSARWASHHPTFIGNCPIISHSFLALSTQWMSSPSRKWGCGVSPRFHLIVFVFGVNKRIRRQGKSKIPNTNGGTLLHRPSSSYRKLFNRVAFRIQHPRRSSSSKVCGASLDDWANGSCVDVLLQIWWVGFSSLGN